jgi:UDP-3-O-[3-hydroxymyristoyl] glucosamine N-acyltransferase
MKFVANQIAQLLGGTVDGDANAEVWKLCKIEEGEPGGISFLANMKYTHYIYNTKSSIVIVKDDFQPEQPVSATLVRVAEPYLAFASLLKIYNEMQLNKTGISKLAYISPSAKVGDNCYVGEFAFLGDNVKIGNNVKIYPQVYVGDNCTIGDNTTLFAGVKIYCDIVVGQRCILHSGCVLGADGFGFAPKDDGTWDKIDQIGNVVIEDDVELGANTCVDRATMGSTIVHKDAKIDNLCQVAHNVVIGANTAIAAQSGIAGSGKVGANCILAGQVGIVGHIEVGDHVTIAAQSGVTNNVEGNQILLGSPAVEAHRQKRNYVLMRNLDKMAKRISDLEKMVEELKKK